MSRICLAALAAVLFAGPALAEDKPVLNVYTYESFAGEYGPGNALKKGFEAECDCTLTFTAAEDGAALFAKLKLEGASTKADVVVGLDNSLMGEAEKSGLFAPSEVTLTGLALPEWQSKTFIPYDFGYFAFVYDSDKLKTPPTSLKALFEDPNGPKVVIEDARTSTPGLGLVAWARMVFGNDAPKAWQAFRPRIVTVTSGWSEAYGLFLKGEADMVLSYSTSPAYHIGAEKKTNYKAAMFEEGHVMQVEVAGIAAASQQQALGRRFLAYLVGDTAQALLPETNWMYPVRTPAAGLPESFRTLATPAKVLPLDPATLAENRKAWVDEWLAATAR